MKHETAHSRAFKRWFLAFERERKRQRIAPGRPVPGFPAPPPGPDEVRRLIYNALYPVGESDAAKICSVHRTTVTRWLSGATQISPSAYAMLKFHAEGVPPGCGNHWQGFYWKEKTVILPDGRTELTALEIAGWYFTRMEIQALRDKCDKLEKLLLDMTRRAELLSGASNDSYANGQDVRSKAFW